MPESRLVTRPEWASYMNTGTTTTPVWSRIGEGFTDLSQALSALEYSRHYVHEKTERTDVTGYAPAVSFSCDYYTENPVIERIGEVFDKELVGTAAQVEILNVNKYQAAEGDAGAFVAFKRSFAIIPDTKGDGVEALILSGQFRAVGDAVEGTFAPAADGKDTGTFAPAA